MGGKENVILSDYTAVRLSDNNVLLHFLTEHLLYDKLKRNFGFETLLMYFFYETNSLLLEQ